MRNGIRISLSSNVANTPPQNAVASANLTPRSRFALSPLLNRFLLLAFCVAADVAVIAYIPHNYALLGPLAPIAIVAFAVFVGLGYSWLKEQRTPLPFSISLFAVHLACITAVSSANYSSLHSPQSGLNEVIQSLALRVVLVVGLCFLALACIPLSAWIRALLGTRWLALQALVAGVLAWCLRYPAESLWSDQSSAPGRLLQALTFRCVTPLLHSVLPGVFINPQQFIIGTDRFAIYIAEPCSGLEGLGLVLIFTVLWLWYFRKEMRFPRALLLVPCALIAVWALNIFRIAALVIIGDAGHPDIAMEGFHSQAGWIAFTLVALLFSISSRRIPWFRTSPPESGNGTLSTASATTPFAAIGNTEVRGESPAVAAYLVPFLAILAAAFLSRAASGSFEWLYPLRFVAAALALWHYRGEIRSINWRFSWAAPLAGVVLFALGLAASRLLPPATPSTLGESLARLSPLARTTWLIFRVAAAVITVPIAEELAFRGYLARRFIRLSDPDFDQQPYSAITPLSMLVSALVYALMYGRFWVLGLLSGLIYAALAKWKSRLGDAVVAHATGSLLLATWILFTGNWSLW